ncbi:MAG: endonuclease domain-containing protein, partial [Dongiaceae bacterium]
SYPLPQIGGGLGRGPDRTALAAKDDQPSYAYRTKTKTLTRARQLRAQMTDAELLLWKHLRRRQLQGCYFRKQCPIGPYIADFACLDAKLIIEVDGGQHAQRTTDTQRDAWLLAHGYRTLRLWNNDVLRNLEGALLTITEALGQLEKSPHAQAH